MAAMLRTLSTWTGFSGAPGYTSLYFEHTDPPSAAANAATDATRGLWVGLSSMLPNDVTVTVSSTVEEVDDAEGELIGEIISTTTLTPTTGADSGTWTAAAGVCLNWTTSSIHHGRRVKGRTFVVPLGGVAYDNNGTIGGTPYTSIRAAANAFVVFPGVDPVVWCRPKYGPKPAGGGDRPLLRAGAHYAITGYLVNDKVAVLKSRRD